MTNDLPVWDLTPFYSSIGDPLLHRDMENLENEYRVFQKKYKNKIAKLTSQEMVLLLEKLESLQDRTTKVGSYPALLSSEDTTKPEYGVLQQKVLEWGGRINTLTLFFRLEWKALDNKTAQKILSGISNQTYTHFLLHIREFAPYSLTEEVEEVIIEKDITGAQSWVRLFTQLVSTLQFELDGKMLTESEVLALGSHRDRDKRKKAAKSITTTLTSRKMELTHIYNSLIADKMLEEKRRGYTSWISALNIANKVSDKTVDSLVTSVSSRYELVSNHYELKKKLLKLPKLYDYDRYAPVEFKRSKTYTWHEAKQIVIEAYSEFSREAGEVIQGFFKGNYIHARLMPNKQGGAFCATTAASVHPYILMNFTGRADDVMTLAHELGHGLHQYWAGKNHGNLGHGMPLTTQELASTFGEFLVFNKLKNETENTQEKLSLLMKKVDGIIATVFRQTAMYLFEERVHTSRRKSGELTYENMCDAWITTQRAMFGKSVTIRDEYKNWWSYIPHFIHTPGYVYSYAFGELVALSLYSNYLQDPTNFVPKYIELLKSGDSDYPVNQLKKLGVNIEDKNFWLNGLDLIDSFIAEEKELVNLQK